MCIPIAVAIFVMVACYLPEQEGLIVVNKDSGKHLLMIKEAMLSNSHFAKKTEQILDLLR